MLDVNTLIMLVIGGFMGLLWWQVKRYITKVDDIENRVIKLETVMCMLGDIRTEIGDIKSDVAVIKSKIE